MTEQDPETIPVIIGVGQINDRPEQPGDGLDPVGLMAEALRRADADAGDGVLEDCDSLAVVAQQGVAERVQACYFDTTRPRQYPQGPTQTQFPLADPRICSWWSRCGTRVW